jgi:hypothetical protein
MVGGPSKIGGERVYHGEHGERGGFLDERGEKLIFTL